MKFDKTHIEIRHRGPLEIFDLSAQVLRQYFGPIMILTAVGAFPWMLVNFVLVGWMVREDYQSEMQGVYWWAMVGLVTSQSQFATCLITRYLGDATFLGRPRLWPTITSTLRRSGFLIVLHGIFRLGIPILLVAMVYLSHDTEAALFTTFLFVPGLLLVSMFVRLLRPFANEIWLLEKTPVRKKPGFPINFHQRSAALHRGLESNIFGRGLLGIIFAIPLFLVALALLTFIGSIFMLGQKDTWVIQLFCAPLAMWMTAVYLSVARFLSYINTRIYQEGWDVELKMRAEAIRFKQRLT